MATRKEILQAMEVKVDSELGSGDNVQRKSKRPDYIRRKQRHILTRMEEEHKIGPLSVLHRSLCEQLKVQVTIRSYRHVRGFCTGYVTAFDRHLNLAMRDVDEIYKLPDALCRKKPRKRGGKNLRKTAKVQQKTAGDDGKDTEAAKVTCPPEGIPQLAMPTLLGAETKAMTGDISQTLHQIRYSCTQVKGDVSNQEEKLTEEKMTSGDSQISNVQNTDDADRRESDAINLPSGVKIKIEKGKPSSQILEQDRPTSVGSDIIQSTDLELRTQLGQDENIIRGQIGYQGDVEMMEKINRREDSDRGSWEMTAPETGVGWGYTEGSDTESLEDGDESDGDEDSSDDEEIQMLEERLLQLNAMLAALSDEDVDQSAEKDDDVDKMSGGLVKEQNDDDVEMKESDGYVEKAADVEQKDGVDKASDNLVDIQADDVELKQICGGKHDNHGADEADSNKPESESLDVDKTSADLSVDQVDEVEVGNDDVDLCDPLHIKESDNVTDKKKDVDNVISDEAMAQTYNMEKVHVDEDVIDDDVHVKQGDKIVKDSINNTCANDAINKTDDVDSGQESDHHIDVDDVENIQENVKGAVKEIITGTDDHDKMDVDDSARCNISDQDGGNDGQTVNEDVDIEEECSSDIDVEGDSFDKGVTDGDTLKGSLGSHNVDVDHHVERERNDLMDTDNNVSNEKSIIHCSDDITDVKNDTNNDGAIDSSLEEVSLGHKTEPGDYEEETKHTDIENSNGDSDAINDEETDDKGEIPANDNAETVPTSDSTEVAVVSKAQGTHIGADDEKGEKTADDGLVRGDVCDEDDDEEIDVENVSDDAPTVSNTVVTSVQSSASGSEVELSKSDIEDDDEWVCMEEELGSGAEEEDGDEEVGMHDNSETDVEDLEPDTTHEQVDSDAEVIEDEAATVEHMDTVQETESRGVQVTGAAKVKEPSEITDEQVHLDVTGELQDANPHRTDGQVDVDPDTTDEQVDVDPNTTDEQVDVDPDTTAEQLDIDPDTADKEVNVEPDTKEKQVKVDPDTSEEVDVEGDITDELVDVDPDTIYEQVDVHLDTTEEQVDIEVDTTGELDSTGEQVDPDEQREVYGQLTNPTEEKEQGDKSTDSSGNMNISEIEQARSDPVGDIAVEEEPEIRVDDDESSMDEGEITSTLMNESLEISMEASDFETSLVHEPQSDEGAINVTSEEEPEPEHAEVEVASSVEERDSYSTEGMLSTSPEPSPVKPDKNQDRSARRSHLEKSKPHDKLPVAASVRSQERSQTRQERTKRSEAQPSRLKAEEPKHDTKSRRHASRHDSSRRQGVQEKSDQKEVRKDIQRRDKERSRRQSSYERSKRKLIEEKLRLKERGATAEKKKVTQFRRTKQSESERERSDRETTRRRIGASVRQDERSRGERSRSYGERTRSEKRLQDRGNEKERRTLSERSESGRDRDTRRRSPKESHRYSEDTRKTGSRDRECVRDVKRSAEREFKRGSRERDSHAEPSRSRTREHEKDERQRPHKSRSKSSSPYRNRRGDGKTKSDTTDKGRGSRSKEETARKTRSRSPPHRSTKHTPKDSQSSRSHRDPTSSRKDPASHRPRGRSSPDRHSQQHQTPPFRSQGGYRSGRKDAGPSVRKSGSMAGVDVTPRSLRDDRTRWDRSRRKRSLQSIYDATPPKGKENRGKRSQGQTSRKSSVQNKSKMTDVGLPFGYARRHVNQLFIRGDNVVLVTIIDER